MIECTFVDNVGDIVSWVIDFLCPNATFENALHIIFSFRRVDRSRAIDEIYPFCESNILPNFCLSRDRGGLADFSFFERVDDAGLPDVGISNETYTNVFLVSVKDVELPEDVDESSFAEGVGDA